MSELVFEKQTETLSANQVWPLGIAGSFFRIGASTWPVTVSLLKDNRIIGKAANMLAGDYVDGMEFDAVWITNGAIAQDVTVQICGGGVGSDRVLGEVSVIDGGKFRTLSNMAFLGQSSITAIAAQYPYVQLYNDVATGKNIHLESMMISSPVAQTWTSGWLNSKVGAGSGVCLSKKSGGTNSVAVGTGASLAVPPGGYAGQMAGNLQAGIPQIINFREPVTLPPGFGYTVQGQTAASMLIVTFEFFEESV